MKTLILGTALLALISGPALAQANWRTIGYKTVARGTDVDTIRTPGDARYRQVRLCSLNRPIRMVDFDVNFENGGQQDVNVRQRIAPGSCTRAIDLKGQRRDIANVRLRYERIQRGLGVPVVRVQAR